MKKYIISLFVFLGICFSVDNHEFSNNQTGLIVNKVNDTQLSVELSIGEINLSVIENKGQSFTVISLDKGYSTKIVGSPSLPQLNQLIEIPYGADVEIEILSQNFTDYNLTKNGYPRLIYPAQEPVSVATSGSESTSRLAPRVYLDRGIMALIGR